MILNYLKTSYINLKKRYLFTISNLLGLSTGISCFLLLMAYSYYEENYDSFHDKKNLIYRITFERYKGSDLQTNIISCMPALGNEIKEEIPEVLGMTRFASSPLLSSLKTKDETFKEKKLYYADTDFFKMFSSETIRGDIFTALEKPYSVVITQSIANKYFGSQNVIGKELKIANYYSKDKFNITAVVKDPPLNSNFDFKVLVSFNSIHRGQKWFENSWTYWAFPTIISVNKEDDIKKVRQKISGFIDKYKGNTDKEQDWKFSFQPLRDIHLKSNFHDDISLTTSKTINILKLIAILVLIISWINYINLTTANSSERSKEIGVRKALGSHKIQIFFQFILEASLFNLLAIILSISVIYVLIKPFCNFIGIESNYEIINQPVIGFYIIVILLVGTILSGVYPAFILSSLKPVEVLKSKKSSSQSSPWVRKILVGFQFVISLLFIFCTLIISHQYDYIKNSDTGIDISKVVVIPKPQQEAEKSFLSKTNAFKDELRKITGIKSITSSYSVPTIDSWHIYIWSRKQGEESKKYYFVNGTDSGFIDTYSLTVIEGRNFDDKRKGDDNSVLVSKKACRLLGFNNIKDALGKEIKTLGHKDQRFKIIGVVADYYHNSLEEELLPMIYFTLKKPLFKNANFFSLKLDKNTSITNVKEKIGLVHKKFFPNDTFDFNLMTDLHTNQFMEKNKNQKIFVLFSFLAIILSCFGVASLSSFIAFLKNREIAIRRTFGAYKTSIIYILAKDFIVILLVSIIIFIPLGTYLMLEWLQKYPNRIQISIGHYFLTIFLVFIITAVVVAFNFSKSIRKKIIKSLSE